MHEIKTTALFGSHRKGVSQKSGKDYNFIELSNGYSPTTFSTELETTATEKLVQGDKVEVTIKLNPFNPRENKLVSIVPKN